MIMNYITDMRIEAFLQIGLFALFVVLACVALSWFIEHDRKARAKEIKDLYRDTQDINTSNIDETD